MGEMTEEQWCERMQAIAKAMIPGPLYGVLWDGSKTDAGGMADVLAAHIVRMPESMRGRR